MIGRPELKRAVQELAAIAGEHDRDDLLEELKDVGIEPGEACSFALVVTRPRDGDFDDEDPTDLFALDDSLRAYNSGYAYNFLLGLIFGRRVREPSE